MTLLNPPMGCMVCGYAWTGPLDCPACGSRDTFHEQQLLAVTAADQGESLTIAGGSVTASAESRTIGGVGVVFGVPGRTSRGLLKVRDANSLRYPADLSEVVLTREHDRGTPRGVLASMEHTPQGTRVTFRAATGPDGDAALREAMAPPQGDGTRRGLSYDVINAVIEGDTLVSGDVIAFGQCAIGAYGSNTRVDAVAASINTTEGSTMHLTPEMMARLVALTTQAETGSLTDAEQSELDALKALAAIYEAPGTADAAADVAEPVTAGAARQPVDLTGSGSRAASVPAVPAGLPSPAGRSATRTASRAMGAFREGDYLAFIDALGESIHGGPQAVTAALADITYGAHSNVISPAAWSNELWSGVEYEPIWSDLFSQGTMTDMRGDGWRFTSKMVMQDYAGNKAAIPTSLPETEASPWVGARMAVGADIDRAYFDFDTPGNRAFLASLGFQARESWALKLDGKVRAYTLANAVAAEGVGAQPSLLRAAAVAVRALRRRRVLGRGGSTWVVVNDEDLMSLMDYNSLTVPEFLNLWGIDPGSFRSDQDVPAGTVLAGAKQAAEVKTLPGSPIRVDAQHIANGGVDEAFFGYWAIEEHHTAGIAKATYTAPIE